MTTDEFEIRSYGKSELAMLYFPESATPKGALNNLNLYIDHKPGLRRQLRDLGSPRLAHSYMPNEVALIVEAFGEPYGKKY